MHAGFMIRVFLWVGIIKMACVWVSDAKARSYKHKQFGPSIWFWFCAENVK